MNKNLKIILFSVTGLLVLGGTILGLKLTQPEDEPEDDEDTVEPVNVETVFTDFDTDQVESVYIANGKDKGYNVKSDGNGGFFVQEIVDKDLTVPYSEQLFSNLAEYISGVSSTQTVEEGVDSADMDKYGLLTPTAEVEAVFKDGTTIGFYVGDATPTGTSTYFRLKDGDDVYAVSSSLLNYYSNDRYFWIERQVIEEYDSETAPITSRIVITRADLEEPMLIESLPERPLEETRTFNTHKLVSPISIELDQEKTQYIVYGMFGLTAKEAVWAGLEDVDYELAGLNEPYCEVELRSGGKQYTLTIGSAISETDEDGVDRITGWYGISSEVPDVLYVFEPSDIPWVYTAPEDLMSEMFLTPYIYFLDQLIIETPDKSYEFKIVGDADDHTIIFGNTVLTDESDFTDFYQYLVGAKGEWIFLEEEDESELIVKVTYKYKDAEFDDDVIEYVTTDDRKSLIRLNGNNIYKCREIYPNRMIENLEALSSGGEIIKDW